MRLNKITLVVIWLCAGLSTTQAQQTTSYKSFFENPYLVNPAFAGESDFPRITFLHQNSMVQFSGSPKTTLFMVDSKLKNPKMGLGLILSNNNMNIINRTAVKLTYS